MIPDVFLAGGIMAFLVLVAEWIAKYLAARLGKVNKTSYEIVDRSNHVVDTITVRENMSADATKKVVERIRWQAKKRGHDMNISSR